MIDDLKYRMDLGHGDVVSLLHARPRPRGPYSFVRDIKRYTEAIDRASENLEEAERHEDLFTADKDQKHFDKLMRRAVSDYTHAHAALAAYLARVKQLDLEGLEQWCAPKRESKR